MSPVADPAIGSGTKYGACGHTRPLLAFAPIEIIDVPARRAGITVARGVAISVPSSSWRFWRRDTSAKASRGDRGQPLAPEFG